MRFRIPGAALFVALTALVLAEHAGRDSSPALEGGARWICPAYGVVAGLSFATGNFVALFSTLISAKLAGCM